MLQIPRHYINNNGVVPSNENRILSGALSAVQPNANQLIVVTPRLTDNDIFGRLFPSIPKAQFQTGVTFPKNNNLVIKHLSVSQYVNANSSSHVLMSAYNSSPRIFELENTTNAIANYVLPWTMPLVEKWTKTTQALEVNTGLPMVSYPCPAQEVIDSIARIMASVNPTGFSTDDMKLVRQEFNTLRRNKITLNRDEIEAYLMTFNLYSIWDFILEFRRYSKI